MPNADDLSQCQPERRECMHKQVEQKEDGRILIYYVFDHHVERKVDNEMNRLRREQEFNV